MASTMNAPIELGQPIRRREDQRFLTGRGRYAADIAAPLMKRVQASTPGREVGAETTGRLNR